MTILSNSPLQDLIRQRFGNTSEPFACDQDAEILRSLLSRGSCRAFQDCPVPDDLSHLLCAAAFSAPTKSDLQQRDVVFLKSQVARRALSHLVSGQSWVAGAPLIAVFCGNNRRQRQLHEWHGIPFANDHLDAFFNATADAAIALGAFVMAAEAMGLGCCPISAVRNEAAAVSDLLQLPEHVFPFAGLAIGYPKEPAVISKRLPLSVTCHTDTYSDADIEDTVRTYDRDRAQTQPYGTQRFTDTFGTSHAYTWSEDKARQYSQKERANFGDYVRKQGFSLG
ncbi:MAG: nitroreductase family protein [Pseudomonadota bacterium]